MVAGLAAFPIQTYAIMRDEGGEWLVKFDTRMTNHGSGSMT